ncbi:MAG: alkaline phosphatase [Bacteroidales bacterium]|nr:alkaline phosphatase [Bacteroidales bacterium]
MKKVLLTIFAAFMAFTAVQAQTPKYVFYFIGDGMGANHAYAAVAYNRAMGQPDPNFWNFPVKGLITTYSASSLVTDSSAAGTALSSGTKIVNGACGVDPEGNWTTSILEVAQTKGWGTGVATSVGVNHATPAAFYGHSKSRNDYDTLSQQLIDSKLDFAAGSSFLHEHHSQQYNDDWIAKAKEAGINVFRGKEEYKKTNGRVIMLSNAPKASDDLPYAVDRKPGDTKLADFTEAAIDHLYSHYAKKGFILMVEGGMIDHAAHANDTGGVIGEVNDMAESVQLALDFAAKHPNETLIIVTADHETGGLTMGYGKYEMHPELLASQKATKDVLSFKIVSLLQKEDVSWKEVKNVLKENLGLWDTVPVDPRAEKHFTQLYKEAFLDRDLQEDRNLYSSTARLASEAIQYLDNAASNLSWSFGSHSGAPLPVYAYGVKAEAFATVADNIDVPKTILKVTRIVK